MLARRSFLKALRAVPFVSNHVATKQTQLVEKFETLTGIGFSNLNPSGDLTNTSSSSEDLTLEQIKLALKIPSVRSAVEDIYKQQYKEVYRIDPDLAVLKSVSLSAKITYQRQRNIKSMVKNLEQEGYWNIIPGVLRKALGV